jgi:hypothetical protein
VAGLQLTATLFYFDSLCDRFATHGRVGEQAITVTVFRNRFRAEIHTHQVDAGDDRCRIEPHVGSCSIIVLRPFP